MHPSPSGRDSNKYFDGSVKVVEYEPVALDNDQALTANHEENVRVKNPKSRLGEFR